LEDQTCSASVPARLVADTRRLNAELGFQPQISLQQGIRRLVDMQRT
jgi:nucleoside-diphosphate-sugar epimerase